MNSDKVAFLCPGQGSQNVGMGKDLYNQFPEVQEIYDKADEILGYELSALSFKGPSKKLKLTKFAQPAIFVHSYALSRLLECNNVKPSIITGHSLGEYTAHCIAGSYSFEDGLKLVCKRALLMNDACEKNQGTMAAVIGLEQHVIEELCKKGTLLGVVQVANLNCPGQIVISGTVEAVNKVSFLAKEAGAARVIPLQVSGAFHSVFMNEIVPDLKIAIDEVHFTTPGIPLISNLTAEVVGGIDAIKCTLLNQVNNPVRWTEIMQLLKESGYRKFLEIGPGNVLKGFVLRYDREADVKNIGSALELKRFLAG